jgi:transcriptional regulator with XRE-family HTH domain
MTRKIGEEIKSNRLKNGLTQKELARASGLSQGYVSGLEQGTRML